MKPRATPLRTFLLATAVGLGTLGATGAAALGKDASAAANYKIVSFWGKTGSAGGQFKGASGLGVDGEGNVYVADSGNHRVQKFTAAGGLVSVWGSIGRAQGQFTTPTDVAIDGTGDVWVTDNGNYRLQRFTTSGGIPADGKTSIITPGGQTLPDTVAVDSVGNVFEVEFFGNRVRRYDAATNWAAGPTWGTAGAATGQFNRPRGVAASPDGSVFVADRDNYRVQRFDAAGKVLGVWGTNGTRPGQFREARGVAVDLDCNVWVADGTAHRLQKFSPAGKLLDQIPDVFGSDVGVGPTGDIYALETKGVDQRVTRLREVPGPRPANVPKVLDLRYDVAAKAFVVSVQYTLDGVACPSRVPALATLKSSNGKPLGTRKGLQLPAGTRTTIDIPVTRAAILAGGFKVSGAFLVARTTLSVVLATNGRQTLTVRGGTLRMPVAAVRSGALPGLASLLKGGAA